MKKSYLYSIVLLLVFSCKNESKEKQSSSIEIAEDSFEKLVQLHWLVGSWTNITREEQSYENWHQENDSTLKAHSFTLVKGDTVFAERLILQQKQDKINLTAIAYNQNEDRPVTFEMVSSENGIFTFESREHDFPTRISYSNPAKDSIHAWIEGTVAGKSRKVDFYFEKSQ